MAIRTISRLFDSHSDARAAVTALEAAGFDHDAVSILANDPASESEVVGETAEDAATGAGTGATIGTVLGGGAGLLAGIGALAIPGVGPIVAAGWLVAALTGAGVGAAAGGVVGSLTGAGVDEAEANVYAEGVRRGGSLVTVRADETRASEVESILDRYNSVHTATREADYRAGGWTGYGQPDGTPGNPPGTMLSRGVDEVAGTNISGAHPENSRGTSRVGPGAASDDTIIPRTPDGTPGNPPGTMASRAVDRAAGTNISGAYPSQSDGTAANPPGTAAERAVDNTFGTDTARR